MHSHWPTVRTSAWALICALCLGACAPSASVLLNDEPFALSDEARQDACRSYGIGAEGSLEYTAAGQPGSRNAPYALTCPDSQVSFDGRTLDLRAARLPEALRRFTEGAYLLTYFADLRVRLDTPGVVDADPPESVAKAVFSDVQQVRVTVTPEGQPARLLLDAGQRTPVAYDPARPVEIRIQSDRFVPAWPLVRVEANAGRVVAQR